MGGERWRGQGRWRQGGRMGTVPGAGSVMACTCGQIAGVVVARGQGAATGGVGRRGGVRRICGGGWRRRGRRRRRWRRCTAAEGRRRRRPAMGRRRPAQRCRPRLHGFSWGQVEGAAGAVWRGWGGEGWIWAGGCGRSRRASSRGGPAAPSRRESPSRRRPAARSRASAGQAAQVEVPPAGWLAAGPAAVGLPAGAERKPAKSSTACDASAQFHRS